MAAERLLPAVLLGWVGVVVLVAAPAITFAGRTVVVTVEALGSPSVGQVLASPSRLPNMPIPDLNPQ